MEQQAISRIGVWITLTRGYAALVDREDYPRVEGRTWRACVRSNSCHAITGKATKAIYMHRMILDPPKKTLVDHIDGDGCNNTKTNMRLATVAQNGWNRRKDRNSPNRWKGYHFRRGAYEASLGHQGVYYCLGRHKTEEAAARAYDKKAFELRGEFANLNFPEEYRG